MSHSGSCHPKHQPNSWPPRGGISDDLEAKTSQTNSVDASDRLFSPIPSRPSLSLGSIGRFRDSQITVRSLIRTQSSITKDDTRNVTTS